MLMSLEDRDIIIEHAKFLTRKKYKIIFSDDLISYTNKKICFILSYGKFSEVSNVYVKFIKKNKMFDVGWIALVRRNNEKAIQKIRRERLDYLLYILKYVEENYDDITNIEYCEQSRILISQYTKNKQNVAWNNIILEARFLEWLGYKYKRKEEQLIYTNGNILISISYLGVTILFIAEEEKFNVGLIGKVRGFLKDNSLEFYEKTLQILQFIQKNYEDITNIEYCRDSEILISQYWEQKRKISV